MLRVIERIVQEQDHHVVYKRIICPDNNIIAYSRLIDDGTDIDRVIDNAEEWLWEEVYNYYLNTLHLDIETEEIVYQ